MADHQVVVGRTGREVDLGHVVVEEFDDDPGPFHLANQGWDQNLRRAGQSGDRHRTGGLALQFVQIVLQACERGCHFHCAGGQESPRRGQPQPAPVRLHQSGLKGALSGVQLLAHRRR